ncbi:MAG: MBL fold metallo-hydrolase [Allosphingosinicella sp.]|uniref:MBL fold metallo-hydrolase n=1 Tax=Allosphingosinicella sp. TaxID=2823234 RepID=UPI003939191D
MKLPSFLFATLALAAPLPVSAAEPHGTATATGHLQIIEPLAPRVWLIRQAEPFQLQPVGNVTLIEQADGLVLVDSGGSPGSGRRVVDLVRSVSSKPLKAVLVTHWHGDHPLGLPAIVAAWPQARIIAHARTRDHLLGPPMADYPKGAPDPEADAKMAEQADGAAAFLARNAADPALSEAERAGFARTLAAFRSLRSDMEGAFVVVPTETFDDSLRIDDPEVPVDLLHLGRANTDGDAVAWLPRQRIVVAGDMVVAPIPFGFGSFPAEWIEALGRLRALEFALLVPGHGRPQADAAYLDRLVGLIAETRAQVAPLAAQGLDLDAVRARVGLSAQKALFAGDDPWLGRWFDAYWVRPMTEAAWREANGLEIVQPGS